MCNHMHAQDQTWEIKSFCFLEQGTKQTSSERLRGGFMFLWELPRAGSPLASASFLHLPSSPCALTAWAFVPHSPPARCPSDTGSLFRSEFCLAGSASPAASLSDPLWRGWFYCPSHIKASPLSKAYLCLRDEMPSSAALSDTALAPRADKTMGL